MVFFIILTLLFTALCINNIVKRKSLLSKIEKDFISNPHFEQPVDGLMDMDLTTVYGFGNSLQGAFRKVNINGHESYVSYVCSMRLFKIVPEEAYRVVPTSGKWDSKRTWAIVGPEVEDPREKRCIRYKFYAFWLAGGAIWCLFMSVMTGLMFY